MTPPKPLPTLLSLLGLLFAINPGNAFYCPQRLLGQGEGIQVFFSPHPSRHPVPLDGAAFAICQDAQKVFLGAQLSLCTFRGWTPVELGSCRFNKGSILVIGGARRSSASSMEWYNPWNWTENRLLETPLQPPRAEHISTVLRDSSILIAGGGTYRGFSPVRLFDPVEETMTQGASMNTDRRSAAAAVVDGVIYVCGGIGDHNLSSCERFQSGVWEPIANMSSARYNLAMVALDRTLYAIGGSNGTDMSLMEAYDIQANRWVKKASMPTPRSGLAAAVLGHSIVVCGGCCYYNLCKRYDVESDNWTPFAPMNKERHLLTLLTVGNGVVALGGRGSGPAVFGACSKSAATPDTVELYDPLTNQWNLLPQKLLEERYEHSAVVF